MNKPNFFIVGAAKSGTTSLYHYLKGHHQVYMSPVKEPNYFSTDIKVSEFSNAYKKNTTFLKEDYFKQANPQEKQLTFVAREDHYLSLFKNVKNEKAIGECSTSYLYSSVAAKNIYQFNPEAKIIIILRNPLYRTFSHYLMAVRYGFTALDFKEAIIKDMNKKEKGWGKSELFIELSLYYEQLVKYFQVYPKEQIQVLFFDDLKENSLHLLNKCCRFLSIDILKTIKKEKHNVAALPRNKSINRFLTETGIKKTVRILGGEDFKNKMKGYFYKSNTPIDIKNEDKLFLKEIFYDDIIKTSQLLGKDLSKWLK